jgi:large subunit ribosomal protein L21
MDYAIIEAGGKQHWVEIGKNIELNKIAINLNSELVLKRVLFGRKNDDVFIGKPYLESSEIEAKVVKHFLGPKVIVYKMKPKKKYRRKNGHRQQLTRLQINNIKF